MNLISCPACGKQVSRQAPACPQCGQPIAAPTAPPPPRKPADEQPNRIWTAVRAVFVVLMLVLLAAGVTNPNLKSLREYIDRMDPPSGEIETNLVRADGRKVMARVGGGTVTDERNYLAFRWAKIAQGRFGAPEVEVIGCFGRWFVVAGEWEQKK